MRLKKLIYMILLISIIFFPKINIISFENITAGIRIDDILILFSFLIYLLFGNKKNNIYLSNYKKIKKIFLLYFIFILFSSILGYFNGTVSLFTSILYVIRKFEYFILFYIGFDYFKDDKKMLILFNIIVLFNFVVIILQMYGVVGAISSGKSYARILTRYYSIFNGPYEMSAFLLALVPFYTLKLIKNDNPIISMFNLIIIMFCIIVSGSRSSIVLYGLIIVLILLREEKNLKIKSLLIFSFVFLASCSLFIVDDLFTNSRFNTLNIGELKNSINYSWQNKNIENIYDNLDLSTYDYGDASFNIRIMKWCNLLDGFLDHPLFGLGMSIVKNASDGAFIRCLVESGIIGFIIWMILLFNIINIKLGNKFRQKYIKYSWLLLLLGGLFIDLFDASKIMCFYWFILGSFIFEERDDLVGTNISSNANL